VDALVLRDGCWQGADIREIFLNSGLGFRILYGGHSLKLEK